MKNRMLTLIARAFLLYQVVKTAKMIARLINQYADHRLAMAARANGRPRTDYSRR